MQLGVGELGEHARAAGDHGAQGIGVAADALAPHQGAVRLVRPVRVHLAAEALLLVFAEHLPAGIPQDAEALAADLLGAYGVGQKVVPLLPVVVDERVAGKRALDGAALVDGADEQVEHGAGAVGPESVGRLPVVGLVAHDEAGPHRREHAGRLADELGAHPADLGGLFRRPLLHGRPQFLEADGPVVDELVVVEVLVDDDVHPGHEQGPVRAGAELDVVVGQARRVGEARVDGDEDAARLLEGLDLLPGGGVGLAVVGVGREHLACLAGQLVDVGPSHRAFERLGHGPVADLLVAHVVGRAEQVEELRLHEQAVAVVRRAGDAEQRLGAGLVAYLVELGSHLLERLVPADALPSALPALSHPLEGEVQTVGMVVVLDGRAPLVHEPLTFVGDGVVPVRVAHDLGDVVADAVDEHVAAPVAAEMAAARRRLLLGVHGACLHWFLLLVGAFRACPSCAAPARAGAAPVSGLASALASPPFAAG